MIPLGIRSSGKYVDNLPFHVWVLLGDSELVEGSIWEAFDKAGDYKMSNVIAILGMNRLGQRGPTELGCDAPVYAARARAFGWHAIEIDGHDIAAIDTAYKEALAQAEKPTCVVVKAVKGSGVSLVANKEGWHGKALSHHQVKEAIKGLGGERHIAVQVAKPAHLQPTTPPVAQPLKLPTTRRGRGGASADTLRRPPGPRGAHECKVVGIYFDYSKNHITEGTVGDKKSLFEVIWMAQLSWQHLRASTQGVRILSISRSHNWLQNRGDSQPHTGDNSDAFQGGFQLWNKLYNGITLERFVR